MGSLGTEPYHFPIPDEDFIKEVQSLEGIVNIFINCVLEPHLEKKNVRLLRNKILYVTP